MFRKRYFFKWHIVNNFLLKIIFLFFLHFYIFYEGKRHSHKFFLPDYILLCLSSLSAPLYPSLFFLGVFFPAWFSWDSQQHSIHFKPLHIQLSLAGWSELGIAVGGGSCAVQRSMCSWLAALGPVLCHSPSDFWDTILPPGLGLVKINCLEHFLKEWLSGKVEKKEKR